MGPSCRICGSSETTRWKARSIERRLQPQDLHITDSQYGATLGLWKCAGCGFVFADGEEIAELTSLYEQLSDPEYQRTEGTRLLQMRWLLDEAMRACPDAESLLDIGAGTGLLVREAAARNLDAVGVEPSRALVEWAKTGNGVDLIQGVFPHPALDGRRFDLVLLVDVIEHVADPLALLRDAESALTPGGLLVVVTPDVSSMAARLLRKRWWHFRLAHVGFFSRRSLERAAATAGLAATRWFRARWFFPVAYLAQRTEAYLPVGWLNRLARRVAPLRWCYRRVVSINLHDSYVVFLRRREAEHEPA